MDLVVIGLGYVGLPLAREACRSGPRVAELDRDAGAVAGLSHVDELPPDPGRRGHSGRRIAVN